MLLLHNKIKYMRARMNHTYKIIENIIKGRSIITILLIKFQFLSNATTMTWNISNEDVESDRRRKKKKKERIRKESYRYIGYEKSKNRSDAMIAKQRIFFFFFSPFSRKSYYYYATASKEIHWLSVALLLVQAAFPIARLNVCNMFC